MPPCGEQAPSALVLREVSLSRLLVGKPAVNTCSLYTCDIWNSGTIMATPLAPAGGATAPSCWAPRRRRCIQSQRRAASGGPRRAWAALPAAAMRAAAASLENFHAAAAAAAPASHQRTRTPPPSGRRCIGRAWLWTPPTSWRAPLNALPPACPRCAAECCWMEVEKGRNCDASGTSLELARSPEASQQSWEGTSWLGSACRCITTACLATLTLASEHPSQCSIQLRFCGPIWRAHRCAQELRSKLARAGHTATPVGDKLVVAGGILLSPSRTMDALVLDPARLAISR